MLSYVSLVVCFRCIGGLGNCLNGLVTGFTIAVLTGRAYVARVIVDFFFLIEGDFWLCIVCRVFNRVVMNVCTCARTCEREQTVHG